MIRENLERIHQQITVAAERSGRSPENVQLLAVSKRMKTKTVEEAWNCGQMLFGENFVQEAQEKIEKLAPEISWHFIGHLQTNKARLAARLFTIIETVDRLKLARALNRHAADFDKILDVLIQVNIGEEKQKSGVLPQHAEQLILDILPLHNIRIRGLMAMPPYFQDAESSRPYFTSLKKMADEFHEKGYFSKESPMILSMGMSSDYTVAIEEGSTLVRIGTAIFGKRD